jgi:hypothetical protein
MPTDPTTARLTAFAADWEANVDRPYPAPGDLLRVHPDLAWMNMHQWGAPADRLYVVLDVYPNVSEKRGVRRDLRVAYEDGDGDIQTMFQDRRIMYPIDHPVFARLSDTPAPAEQDSRRFAAYLSGCELAGWVSVMRIRSFFTTDADMLAAMCAGGWPARPDQPGPVHKILTPHPRFPTLLIYQIGV